MKRLKLLIRWIILLLIIYLILITWNTKTHKLENIANNIGLEFVGAVLYPGKWIQLKINQFWNDYIELRNVREQNKKLIKEIQELKIHESFLKTKVREWERLRKLLKIKPIKDWQLLGARTAFSKIGPSNVLDTFIIDVGSRQGIHKNCPVLVPDGLVGRIFKISPDFSSVLLITDSNSRIPVISEKHRTTGVLIGSDSPTLTVSYVSNISILEKGEVFLTSGFGGIFPKGIPVAKTIKIESSSSTMFKKILVKPTVNFFNIEEVLVLKRQNVLPSNLKEKNK